MKQENKWILDKYMKAYDEAHLNDWEEHKEKRGWNKKGDEKWEEFLEDELEKFEARATIQRNWYRHTVIKAIEAKERGEDFPMFPIEEMVHNAEVK